MWPGSVESAFIRWRAFVHQPNRRLWDYDQAGCTEWACCGDPAQSRDHLEAVMLSMSRRRARELRTLVKALDDDY
ncbi:hypothetical protein C1I98_34125 [Spongiactinospora gelatinilytica]|uniref:Uncharacterized protein n=1 Tax=Spongiactinospora gelatinilytica TaxID=2666298 RepID=A0A2W2FNC7_9ACTN|nr:hypothetical protein C1I98_34125 [Spongiactinospora gelatinilytica]